MELRNLLLCTIVLRTVSGTNFVGAMRSNTQLLSLTMNIKKFLQLFSILNSEI